MMAGPIQLDEMLLKLTKVKVPWEFLGGVQRQQEIDAAPWPHTGYAEKSLSSDLTNFARKIGNHDKTVWLGNFARFTVIFINGFVPPSQVLLDHHFHVLGDLLELFLDLPRLGPDTTGYELFVVVAEVHEGSKILTQADWIKDRKERLTRRDHCEQGQHHGLRHT